MLLDENVQILCSNCHEKEQSTIFHDFKNFIYGEELFANTFNEIKSLIDKILKKRGLKRQSKSKVLAWIKKRYVIDYFYNSECTSCGKSCNSESLPIFAFHHTSMIKTSEWSIMKSKNIEEIIEWLKKDKCVCLCANCHKILHSTLYIKYADIILNSDDLQFKLVEEIQKMKKNIKNFKFKV